MDKFLLKICNKDTKRKSKDILMAFLLLPKSKFLFNGRKIAATSPVSKQS